MARAAAAAIDSLPGSPGRGSGRTTRDASDVLESARNELAALLGISDASRLAFTLNATDSLNLALRGLVQPGSTVVTSSFEHAAVTRPLARFEASGLARVVRVRPDADGVLSPQDVATAARDAAASLVAVTAASNVSAVAQPIEEIAAALAPQGVPLLVDAAQAAGSLPLDAGRLGPLTLVAVTCHKALMGPMGCGALAVGAGLELPHLREGGTGDSTTDLHPESMPARLEAGTPALPALAGLRAALAWWRNEGVAAVRARERALLEVLIQGLAVIPGVRLAGTSPSLVLPRAPLVAFTVDGYAPDEVSHVLETEFRVTTRAGLHCAPEAHRTLGTWPAGTVRASLGPLTTRDDVEALLAGVRVIAGSSPR